MRRNAGAIFRERRPATIMRSDCRGLPRNTSAPKRAISYREQLIDIISIAQHASPNVTGQIEDRGAHWTIFSTLVVRTGMSASRPMRRLAPPVERAFAPDVDITRQKQRREQHNLCKAG